MELLLIWARPIALATIGLYFALKKGDSKHRLIEWATAMLFFTQALAAGSSALTHNQIPFEGHAWGFIADGTALLILSKWLKRW